MVTWPKTYISNSNTHRYNVSIIDRKIYKISTSSHVTLKIACITNYCPAVRRHMLPLQAKVALTRPLDPNSQIKISYKISLHDARQILW